jgi:hypothetical protein
MAWEIIGSDGIQVVWLKFVGKRLPIICHGSEWALIKKQFPTRMSIQSSSRTVSSNAKIVNQNPLYFPESESSVWQQFTRAKMINKCGISLTVCVGIVITKPLCVQTVDTRQIDKSRREKSVCNPKHIIKFNQSGVTEPCACKFSKFSLGFKPVPKNLVYFLMDIP